MNHDMSDDRFRDWDAAYVLGSLSPAERLEYEQHVARCPNCSAAVAELAGMPGLLGVLTADEAFALDAAASADDAAAADSAPPAAHAAHAGPGMDAPPSILPTLLSRARKSRRRSRLAIFGAGFVSVAAAVVLTIVVASAVTPGPAAPSTAQPGDVSLAGEVQFVSQAPSPLSAVASLQDEPWGTRIEWKCTYAEGGDEAPGTPGGWPGGVSPSAAPPDGGAGSAGSAGGAGSAGSAGSAGGAQASETDARAYAMVVTDRAGDSVQVATWTSGPGTVATPTATTSIRRADIASVTIVASDTGQVLLSSTL